MGTYYARGMEHPILLKWIDRCNIVLNKIPSSFGVGHSQKRLRTLQTRSS
jgi:hypothetical protein